MEGGYNQDRAVAVFHYGPGNAAQCAQPLQSFQSLETHDNQVCIDLAGDGDQFVEVVLQGGIDVCRLRAFGFDFNGLQAGEQKGTIRRELVDRSWLGPVGREP